MRQQLCENSGVDLTAAAPVLARARQERYLRRQAEQLGCTLTPFQGEVS